MQANLQIRTQVLENTIQDYVGKGYQIVKKESTRAYLKKRAAAKNMFKFIFQSSENVYIYVDTDGSISTAVVS
ncbi:MAG: hypothetical protein V4642_02830 [Bacteroidota bacterium]